jgi:hypothetical protein
MSRRFPRIACTTAAGVALALRTAVALPADAPEQAPVVVELSEELIDEGGNSVVVGGGVLVINPALVADVVPVPAAEPVAADEPIEKVNDADDADTVIPPPQHPVRPLGGLFGNGLRAVFDAIVPTPAPPRPVPIPLDEAEDGEMPKDPAKAQAWQQRKQIRQQAKHMEQTFQPALRTELEMIRRACGSLSPEARKEILAVGRAAVTRTALDFATRQMQGGQPMRAIDTRAGIQQPLEKALATHVSAAELAAYQAEQRARQDRRRAAARLAIVAKLDRQLDLTAEQRKEIEADLERRFEDSWLRELDDHGVIMNNYRPAPDYANACIEPHLDGSQKEEWQRWRKAAGTAVVGMHFGWNFDAQGLHQEDDWWTK